MLKSYLGLFIVVLAEILNFVLLARVILSWVPQGSSSRPGQLIKEATDPILRPLKRVIPPVGMMDITPLVAFFALQIVRDALLYMISYLP